MRIRINLSDQAMNTGIAIDLELSEAEIVRPMGWIDHHLHDRSGLEVALTVEIGDNVPNRQVEFIDSKHRTPVERDQRAALSNELLNLPDSISPDPSFVARRH